MEEEYLLNFQKKDNNKSWLTPMLQEAKQDYEIRNTPLMVYHSKQQSEQQHPKIEYKAKQAFMESVFDPSVTSSADAKGIYQITDGVKEDYITKGKGEDGDLYDPVYNSTVRDWAMGDLLKRTYINKPESSDSIKHAKALLAYNWGSKNAFDYLTQQKDNGVDIYNSWEWLDNPIYTGIKKEKKLPAESKNYINFVLRDQYINEDKNIDEFLKEYNKLTPEQKKLYGFKKDGGQINYLNLFK